MTDNMKKFLEAISGDKEFTEKLKTAPDAATAIALAKEKGFDLTEEDLKFAEGIQEISDDEAEAVAGGKECYCFAGGGGVSSQSDEGQCACVGYGTGKCWKGSGKDRREIERCGCAAYGQGKDASEC